MRGRIQALHVVLAVVVLLVPAIPVLVWTQLSDQSGESSPSDPAPVAPSAIPASAPLGRYVQVVAHPDDDILFMNPDVATSIHSGAEVTTIYVTSGEANGSDQLAYSSERQAGARAAYAHMAGVPNQWDGREFPLTQGMSGPREQARPQGNPTPAWLPPVRAELYTLKAQPRVRLVFLNLPENENAKAAGGKAALTRLWADPAARVATIRPKGAVVTADSHYHREALIAALTHLLRWSNATLVRAQDTHPDPRFQEQWRHHDHSDHVAVARFTVAAHQRASREVPVHAGGPRSQTTPQRIRYYRNYNLAEAPPNLAPEAVAEKREIFAKYAAFDGLVSMDGPYAQWLAAMRSRWDSGPGWIGRGPSGGLRWVNTEGTRVTVNAWGGSAPPPTSQRPIRQGMKLLEDHSDRHPPAPSEQQERSLPPAPCQAVDGGGSLVNNPKGPDAIVLRCLESGDVYARWLPKDADAKAAQQPWLPLGQPSGSVRGRGSVRGIPSGMPTGIAGADGRVWIAVRDGSGGVSVRKLGEAQWNSLGGRFMADEITLGTDLRGGIEVFGYAPEGLVHWHAHAGSDVFRPAPKASARRPAGRIALARSASGVDYGIFREAGTGKIVLLVRDAKGSWRELSVSPMLGGVGTPEFAVVADTPVLLTTDEKATPVAHAFHQGAWHSRPLPPMTADRLAIASDPHGAQADVIAVAGDHSLWTRKISAGFWHLPDEGSWQPVDQD